jgi:hypothetical protein
MGRRGPPKGRPKTPGSGKANSYKHAQTLEKEELLRQFRARLAAEFDPLLDALFHRPWRVAPHGALPRRHVDEVTDPVIMAKVLNSGETFYRIYARNPMCAIKDILDRVFGTPAQSVDMTVKGQVDVDLVTRRQRARARMAAGNP